MVSLIVAFYGTPLSQFTALMIGFFSTICVLNDIGVIDEAAYLKALKSFPFEEQKKIEIAIQIAKENEVKLKENKILLNNYSDAPSLFCKRHFGDTSKKLLEYIESMKQADFFFYNILEKNSEENKKIKLILNKNKK